MIVKAGKTWYHLRVLRAARNSFTGMVQVCGSAFRTAAPDLSRLSLHSYNKETCEVKRILGVIGSFSALAVLLAVIALAGVLGVSAEGVSDVFLFRYFSGDGIYSRFGDVYESQWVKGKDITTVYPIASYAYEIDDNGRQYQDVWNEAWNAFSGSENSRICYRVEFGTSDGKSFDVLIVKPGDELVYKEYLENYLYDDIRVPKNTWYSHLTPEDTGDLILSSMKITAGSKVDYINTDIKITACVYSGEGDIGDDGKYKGSVTSSVTLVRKAEPLSISVKKGDNSLPTLLDKDYKTSEAFVSGDTVTVKSNSPMAGIYVIWDAPVKPWTITFNGKEEEKGQNGFIHDYIEVDGATECVIKTTGWTKISEIYAYSEGKLPSDVQVWDKPLEKADLLVFSTHADDEVLFFGGAITLYNALDYKTQVVYMCNYWNGSKVREHEKLDGLWAMGLRNYPVNMEFDDYYSETLAEAKKQYDFEKLTASVAENIRRFKPQVIVTHDIDGEYGHGGHMVLCAALREAVPKTGDESFLPESVQKYGAWDVPKTYLHLYGENKLRLDLRQSMDVLNGKTPLEVEKNAYKKHVSQQWTWFYVDDEYYLSCADFGLYRTTVGLDSGANDMMENIVSYAEQERLAEEERLRLEEEERLRKEEEERLKKEEEERLKREEEERLKREEEERLRQEEEERKRQEEEQRRLEEEERLRREEEERSKTIPTPEPEEPVNTPKLDAGKIAGGVALVLIAILICVFVMVPAAKKLIMRLRRK